MPRHSWIPAPSGLSWTCAQLPGVAVHHCGHAEALRPYYVQGVDVTGSDRVVMVAFSALTDAQDAAEDAAARERRALEPAPRPRKSRRVDLLQESLAF